MIYKTFALVIDLHKIEKTHGGLGRGEQESGRSGARWQLARTLSTQLTASGGISKSRGSSSMSSRCTSLNTARKSSLEYVARLPSIAAAAAAAGGVVLLSRRSADSRGPAQSITYCRHLFHKLNAPKYSRYSWHAWWNFRFICFVSFRFGGQAPLRRVPRTFSFTPSKAALPGGSWVS
jgi:hypothetical protein